jgi:protein SCO1/2
MKRLTGFFAGMDWASPPAPKSQRSHRTCGSGPCARRGQARRGGRGALAWLLATGLWLACAQAAPFDPFAASGIAPRPGARVPEQLTFTDQHDQRVRLGELFGKRPVLLVPVYFRCPNVCGAQLAGLFQMLDNLRYRAGRDFELVVFSFDPRETAADARAELARLRQRWPALADSPAVHLLTGPQDASRPLAEALGFHYRYDPAIGQYAHVSAVAALTADGRLSRWLYGLGYQPDDLRLALTEAGEGRLGTFAEQLLLLCYHYDPKLGGYDTLVIRALQVGGCATVLGLALFVFASLRGERRKAVSR